MIHTPPSFSAGLQSKIDLLAARRKKIRLGKIEFASPLLLAPMAAIGNAPFRLLMQDLGAGGTVSELVSCHGINYNNDKTHEMLRIDEREKTVGLQLFGEDPEAMAKASALAQSKGPKFVDINMGCPVKKVVQKGGGSALLKDPEALYPYLRAIKKELSIPLSIKIRTGWDHDNLSASRVMEVAKDCGVEWVAIHGRTRSQGYSGKANWDYIEQLAKKNWLPLIGNGDLHTPEMVRAKMSETDCQALMIARGCLRNPFIFLQAYVEDGEEIKFSAQNYFEVLERYRHYVFESISHERARSIQLRKLIVWFTSGFPHAASFRQKAFGSPTLDEVWDETRRYFDLLGDKVKFIDPNEAFMTAGDG